MINKTFQTLHGSADTVSDNAELQKQKNLIAFLLGSLELCIGTDIPKFMSMIKINKANFLAFRKLCSKTTRMTSSDLSYIGDMPICDIALSITPGGYVPTEKITTITLNKLNHCISFFSGLSALPPRSKNTKDIYDIVVCLDYGSKIDLFKEKK